MAYKSGIFIPINGKVSHLLFLQSLSIHLSIYLYIYQSIYTSINLSIHLSIYLYIYLCGLSNLPKSLMVCLHENSLKVLLPHIYLSWFFSLLENGLKNQILREIRVSLSSCQLQHVCFIDFCQFWSSNHPIYDRMKLIFSTCIQHNSFWNSRTIINNPFFCRTS